MLKKIITLLITLLTLSAVGCISYCYYLTDFVENRFSGRRWQIPSTIYSDTTLLYAGKQMPGKSLQERLVRLGYRKTAKNSLEQGEYIPGEKRISVFLNDLSVAGKQRPGFPVLITFENSSIKNMVNAISGEEIHVLELEPEILMQYFGKDREKRQLVSIRDVPDHLKHAVMAAEDNRFHSHFGISPTGIIRAVYTNLRYGSIRQGGSTLTQQLAKNYFLTPERTYTRKIKELFIALAIEMVFEKDEIMEIYLNEIYFGRNGSISVNGVGEAAAHYFGKRVEQLTLPESAAIAGLIKGPNLYSPYNNMERCVKRRNIVLSAMHKKGWISAPVLEEAAKAPLKTSGFETYRRKAPYFLDYVESQLKTLYPETTLSSMGFSIQTTLDTQIQAAAEKALAMGLERLEKKTPGNRQKKS